MPDTDALAVHTFAVKCCQSPPVPSRTGTYSVSAGHGVHRWDSIDVQN